jgi:hypothetical protein
MSRLTRSSLSREAYRLVAGTSQRKTLFFCAEFVTATSHSKNPRLRTLKVPLWPDNATAVTNSSKVWPRLLPDRHPHNSVSSPLVFRKFAPCTDRLDLPSIRIDHQHVRESSCGRRIRPHIENARICCRARLFLSPPLSPFLAKVDSKALTFSFPETMVAQ